MPMHVLKNVMVPMRDGVRLATDIYLPAGEAGAALDTPLPVILARTSYDKNAIAWADPEAFVPHGYAVVLQDLRGRGQSEGTGQYFHSANPNEGRDGYDTVEWVAAQPWCDGKVGMVGSSHGGMTQTAAALYRPPHLAAIWPDVGPTNVYHRTAREGGAMVLMTVANLYLHAHDAQELRDDPAGRRTLFEGMLQLREWIGRAPYKPGQTPLAVVPAIEKTLFDYYWRGTYDEFWQQDCNDFERHYHRHADIPGTYSGGWYDALATDTTQYFSAMARQNTTCQRLLMGPWTHHTMRLPDAPSVSGEVDFGEAARYGAERYDAERRRWFDRWLKGIANGVEDEPPVRVFVMGGGSGRRTPAGHLDHGGHWRLASAWPLAETQWTPYYLRAGGRLAPARPEGDDAPARFAFDPARPVPSLGAAVAGYYEMAPVAPGIRADAIPPRARMRCMVVDGPMHQQEQPGLPGCQAPYLPLAARPDVLVFQTEPLAADVEVTGPAVVDLWIASSAMDTDFTAKLIDVYPPNADYPAGYHLNLADSIIRCRYREGWDREVLMTPGEVYQVRIQLPPMSNLFKAGHRLRLDISSSNFPRLEVNPNTGEPVGRHTHTVVAHNAVFFDRERPSHIRLPVIPTG